MASAMNDYDALPYSSMPFPETQPTHLAALATLLSLSAPPVETARVLELGCASGGNLIPLALRFPDAVFEGIDLSERHVKEGTALIDDLGLSNITIVQADIAGFHVAGRQFDYILCHGVFSWTPKAVQDAIYRICAECLSEKGIAYISYNVLPGWHLRRIVRDICLHHAGGEPSPQGRVARARAMLGHLAMLPDDATAYGKAVREEAQRNLHMNDSYILGELLSADNDPCHFDAFVTRAGAYGLAYLCDAGFGEALPAKQGAESNALMASLTGGDNLALEQYADFFTGRTFRRSLLVKASAADRPVVSPHGLAQLHFSCALTPEKSDDTFVLRRGAASLTTNDPAVGQALLYLAAAYPETRAFDKIVAHVAKATGHPLADFVPRVSDALLRTALQGHVAASTQPLKVGGMGEERPALWPLAQAQIRFGQTWVSNLLHTPINLPPQTRFIAALFDGINTSAEIEARLAATIADGGIVLQETQTAATTSQLAQHLFAVIMKEFRRNALLSPVAPELAGDT